METISKIIKETQDTYDYIILNHTTLIELLDTKIMKVFNEINNYTDLDLSILLTTQTLIAIFSKLDRNIRLFTVYNENIQAISSLIDKLNILFLRKMAKNYIKNIHDIKLKINDIQYIVNELEDNLKHFQSNIRIIINYYLIKKIDVLKDLYIMNDPIHRRVFLTLFEDRHLQKYINMNAVNFNEFFSFLVNMKTTLYKMDFEFETIKDTLEYHKSRKEKTTEVYKTFKDEFFECAYHPDIFKKIVLDEKEVDFYN